jgi:hypothetical protein
MFVLMVTYLSYPLLMLSSSAIQSSTFKERKKQGFNHFNDIHSREPFALCCLVNFIFCRKSMQRFSEKIKLTTLCSPMPINLHILPVLTLGRKGNIYKETFFAVVFFVGGQLPLPPPYPQLSQHLPYLSQSRSSPCIVSRYIR